MTVRSARLAPPSAGEVISYAYLWTHERDKGRDEASKDRPCAVVLTVRAHDDDQVVVLPITSRAPQDPSMAIEIPHATRRRLFLQEDPCWVVISEVNLFRWPGPDLRPAAARSGTFYSYGLLPAFLFTKIRNAVLARHRARRLKTVRRTR